MSSASSSSGDDGSSFRSCLVGRVACEHFEDNHLVYGGNLLLRLAQVYALHLATGADAHGLAATMNDAVEQECPLAFAPCRNGLELAEECIMML